MRKKGGSPKNRAGFTIVETLIVLAVTSVMFMSAAVFISGRRASTEFQVGIRDLRSKMQTVINQASAGNYTAGMNFDCTNNVSNPVLRINTPGSGSKDMGTTKECVFIGNSIMFSGDRMFVLPIAGLRETAAGKDVTTLAEAKPTAIGQGTSPSNNNNGPTDTVEVYPLPVGLKFVRANYNGSAIVAKTSFGFSTISSLANFQTIGTEASTGVQSFRLHQLSSSLNTSTVANAADSFNNENNSTGFAPASQVDLCFESTGTEQSVLFTVGGDNSTAVQVNIRSGKSC